MAKKQGTQAAHGFFEDTYTLHNPVGDYQGGSCLSEHRSEWKENDSCSYRWQGIKKATENPGPYNSHPNSKYHLSGTGFGWPAVSTIASGRAGDIVKMLQQKIFGTALKQLVEAKNFTNGFSPYGNQVHHILPIAVLQDGINDATQDDVDRIKDICDGLLKEKYNINYKHNMIILPTEWSHACKIGLPTHMGSHPNYSDQIFAKVQRALTPYSKVASQSPKHPKPDFFDLAYELNALAENMYISIVNYGQSTLKGRCKDPKVSVDMLPAGIF